jgi:DNA repair ATPase RecN
MPYPDNFTPSAAGLSPPRADRASNMQAAVDDATAAAVDVAYEQVFNLLEKAAGQLDDALGNLSRRADYGEACPARLDELRTWTPKLHELARALADDMDRFCKAVG